MYDFACDRSGTEILMNNNNKRETMKLFYRNAYRPFYFFSSYSHDLHTYILMVNRLLLFSVFLYSNKKNMEFCR